MIAINQVILPKFTWCDDNRGLFDIYKNYQTVDNLFDPIYNGRMGSSLFSGRNVLNEIMNNKQGSLPI